MTPMPNFTQAPRRPLSRTDLQVALQAFTDLLADVERLSAREQATFAEIAEIAIAKSLGPALLVSEAERLLMRAAA